MEGYTSEQEQVEAIKKWWKENGKLVIIGLVVGLGVIFGGKSWLEHKNTLAESASMEYEQLLEDLRQKNSPAVSERGEHIIAAFPKTPYASLAALALAKTKQEEVDYESARAKLQWVVDHAREPEMVHTARIRLAKVMIAQGEPAQAITLLNAVATFPENFIATYEEIKGDAYIATGESVKAAKAYKKALDTTIPGTSSQQLQMKLDDIAPDAN